MPSQAERTPKPELKRFDFSGFPEAIELEDCLSLRLFTADDAERLEQITASDEDVQRYIPWAGDNKAEYIARVNRNRQHRGPRYGIWQDEQLVGHFAIFPADDMPNTVELGYLLDKPARGQGIVSKALGACSNLVQQHMPGVGKALCINDSNFASQKVAERLGYTRTYQMSGTDRVYLGNGA